jgi:transposase
MKVLLHYPDDLIELRRLTTTQANAKQRDRYRVVLIAAEGMEGREIKREQIAAVVGRSRQFVDEWVKRYRKGGLGALKPRKQPGRASFLTDPQKQQLKALLDGGPQEREDPRCVFFGQDIRQLIQRHFAKVYSLSGVYKLLHELGYSWLCPRPRHPKGDPQEQEAFKKKVVEQIERVRQEHPDKRVLTFFQDEARFGQKGTITRQWAATGSRPTTPRQNQYDYLYVYGAVCPDTGTSVALITSCVNTQMMNHFLSEFSASLAKDVHAVMILDQAGWHTSKDLLTPKNLTLIYLPPRSPELNPIENLWHWITSHYWSNRIHADYNAMLHGADAALAATFSDLKRVRSICKAPYLQRAI